MAWSNVNATGQYKMLVSSLGAPNVYNPLKGGYAEWDECESICFRGRGACFSQVTVKDTLANFVETTFFYKVSDWQALAAFVQLNKLMPSWQFVYIPSSGYITVSSISLDVCVNIAACLMKYYRKVLTGSQILSMYSDVMGNTSKVSTFYNDLCVLLNQNAGLGNLTNPCIGQNAKSWGSEHFNKKIALLSQHEHGKF